MANSLKVNWNEVGSLSKNTLEQSVEFEEARQHFQEIVNSITECWEGSDSEEFIKNADSFLTSLKKDSLYFEALGNYFDKSSKTYNKVVEDHAQKVEVINKNLEEEANKHKLVPDNAADGRVGA